MSLTAALAFESVYRISVRPREAQLRSAPGATAMPAAERPFSLRLVDSGGVGIPLDDDWGHNYSHDRRTFRDVILERPPYVDEAAFARLDAEWRMYVERMLAYGNNAIVVPMLLELIDFDRLPAPLAHGAPVYDADSVFRRRHAEVRRHFAPLLEWTSRRGMRVFLDTDLLALTPPLRTRLRRVAPAATPSGIDTKNPAAWAVYRAAFDELFEKMPFITGS